MEIETLKRSHLKRNIIIGVVIVLIISAVILTFTRAKYRVTESIPLVNGTINYSAADLNIVAITVDGEPSDTIPEGSYELTEESYCTVDGEENSNITLSYDSNTQTLTVIPFTTRGTKCYLDFEEKDITPPTITNVTSSVTKTSITVNVTANDNGGEVPGTVVSYFYRIGGSGSYTETSSSSHTFNSLSAGTRYTIEIYVRDNSGNDSEVYSTQISTENNLVRDVLLANYPTRLTRSNFSSTVTNTTTGTIYYADTSKGRTYYFAGNPTDNWVRFGGFYWRIIRINEDGTIRMIYHGTNANTTGEGTQIQTSAFNSTYSDNMYVGFKYTSGSVHGTGTNSTILTALNNWYSSNLASYASSIDGNAGFCGDRTPYTNTSGTSGGGTGTTTTYYGAFLRLFTNKTPTFDCPSEDLYTTSGSSNGNKSLTYPIGLITADEVAYAGGVNGSTNSSYYLYTNQNYWTMSPSSYPFASVFVVNSNGYLSAPGVNFAYGVRPVVNLKADVTISGSGTTSDPYVIS